MAQRTDRFLSLSQRLWDFLGLVAQESEVHAVALYSLHTRRRDHTHSNSTLKLEEAHELEHKHNSSSGAQSTEDAEDDAELVLPAA